MNMKKPKVLLMKKAIVYLKIQILMVDFILIGVL